MTNGDFTVVETSKVKKLTESDMKLMAVKEMIEKAECMCDCQPPGLIKQCSACELRDELKDLFPDD